MERSYDPSVDALFMDIPSPGEIYPELEKFYRKIDSDQITDEELSHMYDQWIRENG